MSLSAGRLEELLVDRATEGLDSSREMELNRLLPEYPDLDPESFELAAAAIELACFEAEELGSAEALPAELRARVDGQARRFRPT